jgi:Domain of unknown function (DUF4352)
MWVKNIGRSQHTYFADYQRLLDSEGRLFSPNLRVTPLEYDQVDINPGNSTAVSIIFDVPKGTQPSQYMLLLHASPDSAGVTVRLPDSYDAPFLATDYKWTTNRPTVMTTALHHTSRLIQEAAATQSQ